jgi:predicted DNA-binding transcriptional regulator AlpA
MDRYLSLAEVAQLLGIQYGTVAKYDLPEPDVMVGKTRGWRPETIERWQQSRPGQGHRTDLSAQ